MTNADRTERMRALSKLALGILRRCGERCTLDRADGRFRAYDVSHNEFSLSFRRRVDDADRLATLVVKFEGEMVLAASWTVDGFVRRTLKPGAWEDLLRRYDRIPALAGCFKATA
ncbi:hypothetical protein [Bradyrhizobium sp. NP1]|uniref:hypothetical protein n=1 Tax=Bradyrhizobium sp. NP1 TaxID=3049772 RepID=UPI0025A5E134|nr:hypothetical protein [Bradyrhizobium sp. NP1]WJR74924.1 hypothetical protein QOU61_19035 [Bradyrhizobium sp. NP1]